MKQGKPPGKGWAGTPVPALRTRNGTGDGGLPGPPCPTQLQDVISFELAEILSRQLLGPPLDSDPFTDLDFNSYVYVF